MKKYRITIETLDFEDNIRIKTSGEIDAEACPSEPDVFGMMFESLREKHFEKPIHKEDDNKEIV